MAPPGQEWRNRNLGGPGRGGRGGRGGGRGGGENRGRKLCRNFQQTGQCPYGDECSFSHDLPLRLHGEPPSRQARERPTETPEQQQAKADYNRWKRQIKGPPKNNDIRTMESIWTGALAILNGDQRDWKQMLPRDLDDDEYYGRQHMHALLGMVANTHGHTTFIDLARPFLLVITHPALLDCLSVDTFVGRLYNFIGGSNGSRAILFFQRLSKALFDRYQDCNVAELTSTLETTLIAMSTAIRELLRREQRATFHDDLPALIDSIQNVSEASRVQPIPVAFQIVRNIVGELRGMVARATGLLQQEEEPQVGGVSTTVVTSTYPRELNAPRDRHDNDKLDITKINILPTEDEIRSDHPPFLPSTDLDQPHFLVDQAERHIDTHFRLLRHDCFGELIEALGGVMVALENSPALLENSRFSLGNMRAYCNSGARVSYIALDERRGLEAQISFPQPHSLRKKTAFERSKWWEESRRLEEGILLCLLYVDNTECSLLFLTVSEKATDPKKEHGLSFNNHEATITAKLATRSQHDLEALTHLSCQTIRGLLVEVPGVLLSTFIPVLENLQNMQRLSRLPFRQWILPDRTTHSDEKSVTLEIPPPLYARAPGFTFSLNAILKDSGDDLSIDARTSVDDGAIIDILETRTRLDRGQCQALIAALTRELAFIQGPPGTGKSYLGVQLMSVLLACKDKAKLGPVIVVCYTNHALDQFLEHLISVGIERIIRIGGQSQSKLLEGKNLRLVSQGESKTKHEGYLLASTYRELEEQGKIIRRLLGLLHGIQKRRDWANLKKLISRRYPLIYRQFSRFDAEGFETVGRHPFDVWMSDGSVVLKVEGGQTNIPLQPLEPVLARANRNAYDLSFADRHRLADHWVEEIRIDATDELYEAVEMTNGLHKQLTNVHDEIDRRVLETADVIGVTTTGLARRIATLQHVTSKVVICEEAGEVMEPHMLSALLPSVEHFIQIGDHRQLRPQINNFKLSLESQQGTLYQLDRSQFERLSIGERGRPAFPLAQLNVQRRMRPEISALIRNTIYPLLIDHESTKGLPDVVGMRRNVFWLDHDNIEEGAQADVHQKSHSNHWEIDMVHALVRHILRQGVYNSTDIAVLTPYTGQLQKLRAKMRNDFEIVLSERDQETLVKDGFNVEETSMDSGEIGTQPSSGLRPLQKKQMSQLLRIATVDNFQGEEAKVVIVSLVRSNKDRKVGFLKTTNRINVLISRAQHGMYLIGNTDTYSGQTMWSDIQGMLQGSGSIGNAFALCCPRHPETEIQASQPDDFARVSPEGGCQLACDRRLPDCGHRCTARCHSESMHRVFSCPQPCQRLHDPCRHSCQKQTCGEDCGLCMTKVSNVQLPCGHSKDDVPCHLTQDVSKVRCNVVVQKEVTKCKHIVDILCSRDANSPTFKCPIACGTILNCGHECPGTCGRCNQDDTTGRTIVKHTLCSKICGQPFGACNHVCRRLCHKGKECGPCRSDCEVRCAHSKCTLRCHEACAPCVEKCSWSCDHQGDCSMPCAAPCTRLPCNKRCTQALACGHQCPGICGEICPQNYCQTCSDRQDDQVDLLEMKKYSEIDLDETPIVVLGCAHPFTAETLDGHMGMTDVYEQDVYGEFKGLKDVSGSLARSIPRCPNCQGVVRQYCTQRYNRVINRAVIDEMSKRFLVNGKDELRELEQRIAETEHDLEESQEALLLLIRQTSSQAAAHSTGNLTPAKASEITEKLKERYIKGRDLEKAIQLFRGKVADKHQPAQKLHDATVRAARERPIDKLLAGLDITGSVPAIARDRRITFGGRIAQLQAECVVLTDTFPIAQLLKSTPSSASIKISGGAPEKVAKPFFKTCRTFVDECIEGSLPKMGVEATLYYAKLARSNESYCRSVRQEIENAAATVKTAKALLETALELCEQPFQNSEQLLIAVEESIKLLRKEWYETVTPEELAAVKKAMISGSRGFATHSGHWYNCANGHPFAIGECGMPMQQARCPECGAPVGGQNHRNVAGVTRAMEMER